MTTNNATASDAAPESGGATESREVVLGYATNELIFGVVGHVGSGTTEIAKALEALLGSGSLAGGAFDTEIIKAREVISEWAQDHDKPIPSTDPTDLTTSEAYQDLGDDMRSSLPDHAAVARGMALKVRAIRAAKLGITDLEMDPIQPDGKRRAYILDSIRHPAEVQLLQHIYQDAFILVGVVCEESTRLARLTQKYSNAGHDNAKKFMDRDAKASDSFGQRVSDAFHLSGYFVDNSVSRVTQGGESNEEWDINEKLSRLIKIVTHAEIVRPDISETAMHHAYGAKMRSACLSRQVGAAVTDSVGNVLATGANEVPQAGGGVYGESFATDVQDNRCAYRRDESKRICSNTVEQNEIIDDLLLEISELSTITPIRKNELKQHLRETRIGGLLEFSRAVHAEMDALLSVARTGVSTVGTRLFVTTFPCHYCARHIVSAGVDEVQFIEPYPKSKALKLHDDAIQVEYSGWEPPSEGGARVLFRPFTGVAPRMYRRAFLKDRDLKDDNNGKLEIRLPIWGSQWHLRGVSYVQLEAELAKNGVA